MLWRLADIRPAFFWAYMRWSAILSASATSDASSGSSIAPYEQPISNPSPCSDSAAAAPMISGSDTCVPGLSRAQNSSPPMRKADPRPRRKLSRLPPSRTSRESPAGWPNVSLYSLKPSRSNSTSMSGSLTDARGSSHSSTLASARRLPRPVSASVCASLREKRSIATLSRKVSIVRTITATSEAAASATATTLSSATQP